MIKVQSLKEEEIREIAEAFAGYQYEDGEKAVFSDFMNHNDIVEYISEFVRAGIKGGWLYATSPNHEGFIIAVDSGEKSSLRPILMILRSCIRIMGIKKSFHMLRCISKGGKSLEDKMKKQKKRILKVELLAVTKSYQGQGYMRKTLDIAFNMGKELNVPVILDTDGKLKRDKYCHLGMKCVGERRVGDASILYDLVKYPN